MHQYPGDFFLFFFETKSSIFLSYRSVEQAKLTFLISGPCLSGKGRWNELHLRESELKSVFSS